LVGYLCARKLIAASASEHIAQLRASGVAAGDALLDMNAIAVDALATAIRERILEVVQALLQNQEGEFSFRLNESLTAAEIDFDPTRLFKEGGLTPQKILGTSDKEKFKPLRALEETMKAGMVLAHSPRATPPLPGMSPPPQPKAGEPGKIDKVQ